MAKYELVQLQLTRAQLDTIQALCEMELDRLPEWAAEIARTASAPSGTSIEEVEAYSGWLNAVTTLYNVITPFIRK